VYLEIEKQTGMRSPNLDGPRLPSAGERIWEWYSDLASHRQHAVGFGVVVPQPISYESIDAYFRRFVRKEPEPWQLRLICDLDMIYRSTMNSKDGAETLGSASNLRRSLQEDV